MRGAPCQRAKPHSVSSYPLVRDAQRVCWPRDVCGDRYAGLARPRCGCGCKLPAAGVLPIVRALPVVSDERVLVGSATGDDAGVLRGAARGRCPERPSKPPAARASRREGSTPSPFRDEPLTIGTAGHVDHGKTALVAALTGVDTDRLPEEKTRGLSIVLGYAPLRLPSGRQVSIIDVPGHERFVRTMVAGATGVDGFLMVVAADDGVMPQTREHADVLRGLGVEHGVVAVTKADLADPGRARSEAQELLPGVEVVVCSTQTGTGVEQLSRALESLAASLQSRARVDAGARLHIDRAFTVKGRGTVVTGTLWSGSVTVGDTLQLLPKGLAASVRSVQVHDTPIQCARAGQRVAVNLRGVERAEVTRGDLLATPGIAAERSVLDCRLDLRGTRHGERVQVHHGTRDVPARLCELGEGVWQLRLESPLLACEGDRVIVRRHAPAQTLGGGVVLDAAARRRGRNTSPRAQADGDVPASRSAPQPRAARSARGPQGPRTAPLPSRPPVAPRLLAELERGLREAGWGLLSEAQLAQVAQGSSPREIAVALRTLREQGRAVRVSGRLYACPTVVADAKRRISAAIEREGALTLAQARDTLGVGRKAAQALLEHLDRLRVTRRLADDSRVLAR